MSRVKLSFILPVQQGEQHRTAQVVAEGPCLRPRVYSNTTSTAPSSRPADQSRLHQHADDFGTSQNGGNLLLAADDSGEGHVRDVNIRITGGQSVVRRPQDTRIHVFLPSSLTALHDLCGDTHTSRSAGQERSRQLRGHDDNGDITEGHMTSPGVAAMSSSGSTNGSGGEVCAMLATPTTMADSVNEMQAKYLSSVDHASSADLVLLRDLSLRIGARWRDVAAGLGFTQGDMEVLLRANPISKGAELAYRTLAIWWRNQKLSNAKASLQKVFKDQKLLAAEAVLMNRHMMPRHEIPVITSPVTSSNVTPGTAIPETPRGRTGPRPSSQRHLTTSGRPKTSVVRAKTASGGRRLVLSNSPAARQVVQEAEQTVEEDPVHLCVTNTVIQRPRTSMATSSRGQQQQEEGAREDMDAELPIHLSVGDLVAADPRRALLRFYTTVLRDEERHMEALTSHPALSGVSVRCFTVDSFAVHVTCRNQQMVTSLETLHRTRKLGEVLTSVLATPDVLGEVGVQALRVETSMHRAEVERYRKSLRTLDSHQWNHGAKRGNVVYNGVDGKASAAPSKTSWLMLELNRKLSIQLASLRWRHQLLEENMDDFLMALKMSKSVDMDKISTLSDVIRAFTFLRDSPSIGKNMRTDLVREYLSIVNLVRITCDEIQRDLSVNNGTSRDAVVAAKLSEVETMLEPNFDFSELVCELRVQLMPMERKFFRGLLSFIPCLLEKLSGISEYIKCYWENPQGIKDNQNNKRESKPYTVRFPSIQIVK